MELLIIAAMFIGVMWFTSSRARKQQAAAMAFRDSLEPGLEVMTIGRMYGTVLEVDGDRVTLELSDGVVGVWDKAGISRLVEPVVPADDEELDEDEEYLDDEDYSDEDYSDEEEYDDENLEDEEAADGESDEDPEVTEADDTSDGSDWADVDVPDDASSLTDPDPDKDENTPR